MNAANLVHALDTARNGFMMESIRIDRPYWEYRKIILDNVGENYIRSLLVGREQYEVMAEGYGLGTVVN